MRRATLLTLTMGLLLVLASGIALAATINGTSGDNFLRGTDSSDRIGARGGDDEVRARAGNDDVFGGTGNDLLFGMKGNDLLVGGDGNDQLQGGTGNDTLKSRNDADPDNLNCGPGNDDTAFVELNDVIDDRDVEDLVVTALDNTVAPVTSCETIVVFVTNDISVTLRTGEVLDDDDVTGGTLQDLEDALIDLGIIEVNV